LTEVDLPADVAALAARGPVQVRLRAITPTAFAPNVLEIAGGEDPILGATLVILLSP
jgi:hypothetical protein